MKLKGKLIMSAAALAACAATLTSTTYAWYTTNTEATIGQVSGATSTSTESSQLYVANATSYDIDSTSEKVGSKATAFSGYTASATPKNVATSTTIEPVYSDLGSHTYKKLSGEDKDTNSDTYTTTYADEIQGDIFEYVLRFKTNSAHDADMPVYLKTLEVDNTVKSSDEIKMYPNVSGAENGIASDNTNTQYFIDLLKALKMDVYVGAVSTKEGDEGTSNLFRQDYQKMTTYSFESYSKLADVNMTNTPNALNYLNNSITQHHTLPTSNYNVGNELTKTKPSNGDASPLTLFSIPADSDYVEVRFVFYLDGWDSACYDVCRKQGFTASMEFTTISKDATIYTVA